MTEERAKAPAQDDNIALPEPPPRRLVLDMPSWLPLERVPRPVIIGVALVVLVALVAGTTVPFAAGWVDQDDRRAGILVVHGRQIENRFEFNHDRTFANPDDNVTRPRENADFNEWERIAGAAGTAPD